MTLLDWTIVVGVNGAIIVAGLILARKTKSSVDWFLASRGLPWWLVGLSMFATAVDSGDYVAVVGGAYSYGINNLTTWWLGMPIGWFLVSYVILVPLYRSGMFTNAEYLEHRFGPTARVLSAIIQLQYRTNVLANIAFSLYLLFRVLTGWGDETWWVVVAIAFGAAIYTATGGLRSVAVTDAIQSIVMAIASIVLWVVIWNVVGGWSGLEKRLERTDPKLVDTMLHVGGQNTEGVPSTVMILSWVIILSGYVVVNHSQSMRMLAARSLTDLKIAALVGSILTALIMWFNVSLGVMGRGILPNLALHDEVYPRLVQDYLGPGLIGVVVAGLLAGGISTYDSIGSALAAVFTRDIYARFFVKNREDRHYLTVSRVMTFVVIALSFGYVPFLKEGMIAFYIRLTSIAVTPLFTIYLMGTMTRVNRKSGTVGLLVGMTYGLTAFLSYQNDWPLELYLIHPRWAYLWSILVTATAMVLSSAIWGWERKEHIEALTYSGAQETPNETLVSPAGESTWLESTRREAAAMAAPGSEHMDRPRPWYASPWFWSCVFLAVIAYINLVVLW